MKIADLSTKLVDDFFVTKSKIALRSPDWNAYSFQVFCGLNSITVSTGDVCFWSDFDNMIMHSSRGPATIRSSKFAVVIRGYAPPNKSAALDLNTNLPYINGCSTRQIFPPERPGDPTVQLLKIPKHTSEQAHHIHSTFRVVYVLKGQGVSVVGNAKYLKKYPLEEGMTCILPPMVPHHFKTQKSSLFLIPIHIFSSIGGGEFDHPMFNGTLRI